jgi:hypothetical protein
MDQFLVKEKMVNLAFLGLTWLLISFPFEVINAQVVIEIDSLDKKEIKIKNPKVATILSVVLPGAGQVYNNRAYKVPILYSGIVINIYFTEFNNRRYQLFRESLFAFDKNEPNAFPNLNRDALVRNVNYWRRNRDLNYLLFIATYALQIVDAQVDAHLSGFDVSDDLSLKFEPVIEPLMASQLVGFSVKLKF